MKRYNRIDGNAWILGVLVPILLFFVSMNATYAYFTASTSELTANMSTAVVKIEFANDKIQVNTVDYDSQLLTPGDTIKFVGKIQNSDSAAVYAVVVLKTVITKASSDVVTLTKYFTRSNNAWVELAIVNNAFNGNCFEMPKNTVLDFVLDQTLDGADYGIDFMGAGVDFSVSAYAIQVANLSLVQANTRLYEKTTV